MKTGIIIRINGPIVEARQMEEVGRLEVVEVGELRLIGEVIRVRGEVATIQVASMAVMKPQLALLAAKAKFPLGPFALAVQRDLPVLAVQVMKDNVKRYRIIIAEIAPSSDAVKPKDKMQSLAQAYARNLEATVKSYPHQWFNYYDFWKDNE